MRKFNYGYGEIKELEMRMLRVSMERHIPKNVQIQSLNLESILPANIDALVLQLSGYLLSNKVHISEKVVENCKYPINWFEAIKERFLPNFLRIKFPVKYKTIETKIIMEHIHICPHINEIYPDNKAVHLTFMDPDMNKDCGGGNVEKKGTTKG